MRESEWAPAVVMGGRRDCSELSAAVECSSFTRPVW